MMNFTATLNGGVVAEAMAYAPLEQEYAGTAAIITNTVTGVTWTVEDIPVHVTDTE